MAIWLVRAGKFGEFESKFLNESKIYLTWERSNHDLSLIKSKMGFMKNSWKITLMKKREQ